MDKVDVIGYAEQGFCIAAENSATNQRRRKPENLPFGEEFFYSIVRR